MNEIEKTEGEIKVLQAKLELLKEMEKHKSPAEEAYKRVYGNYPDTGICNGMSYVWWDVFCKGYNASKEDYKVGEYQPKEKEQKWDVVRESVKWCKEHPDESVKWCKEHPDESVEDYLKPHTPEKTEQLLREAFQKVQQTEEWKETQRKIDSNYDKMVEERKSQKLWNMVRDELGYSIDCCDEIVDLVEKWLPKPQSAAGSQNVDTELLVDGFNDCLTKIKGKLR